MAPLSMNTNWSTFATAFATVLFPHDENPSIAMIKSSRFIICFLVLRCLYYLLTELLSDFRLRYFQVGRYLSYHSSSCLYIRSTSLRWSDQKPLGQLLLSSEMY